VEQPENLVMEAIKISPVFLGGKDDLSAP